MDIPAGFRGPVHFFWNTKYNFFHVGLTADMPSGDYLYMGCPDVTASFDPVDVVQQKIDSLEAQRLSAIDIGQKMLEEIDEEIKMLREIEK